MLANLVNDYVTHGALLIQRQGAWDDSTLTGIEAACGY